MLEILRFIFSSFWRWLGVAILLETIFGHPWVVIGKYIHPSIWKKEDDE